MYIYIYIYTSRDNLIYIYIYIYIYRVNPLWCELYDMRDKKKRKTRIRLAESAPVGRAVDYSLATCNW